MHAKIPETIYKALINIAILIALVSITSVFSSCSSLSKSQVRVCNRYFNELEMFNNYTAILNEKTAEVRFNRQMLFASTVDSTSIMIDVLDTAIHKYQREIVMPFELRKSMLNINRFVNGYSFKSSYNTDFLRNTKTFLVDYIPFGLGSILYEIIYATRKILIKPNVGRKIKKHVASGLEFMPECTKNIAKYSVIYYDDLLVENRITKESYQDFVNKLREKPDSYDLYAKYNPVFVSHYGNVVYTMQMAEHLKLASNKLDSLHRSLCELTSKRRRIKGSPDELTDFSVEVNYLKKLNDLLERSEQKSE